MESTKAIKSIAVKEDDKWQIEDDVRTLERSEEIRKDPERMSRAVKMMEDKMDKIKSFVEMNKQNAKK